MSGSRGRLKEHLIGIHTQCDWIKKHVIDSTDIIQDQNPEVLKGFQSIGEIAEQLDDFTLSLFQKI